MIKILLLLSLFALVACQDDGQSPSGESTGGEFQFIQKDLDADDQERLRKICDAISSKSSRMHSYYNNHFMFGFSKSQCGSDEKAPFKNVEVFLDKVDENTYFFSKVSGGNFFFPSFETTHSGMMKTICANRNNFVSPIAYGESGAIVYTTVTSTKHCNPNDNNLCVHIQKATAGSGDSFKIHTNEWIKFKLDDPRRGFFVERKMISNCDGGTMEVKAILR